MAIARPGLAGTAAAALLALGGCAADPPPPPQVALPQDAVARGVAIFFAVCADPAVEPAAARAAERGFRAAGDEAIRDLLRGRTGVVRARSGREAEGLFLQAEPRLCEVTLAGPDSRRVAPAFADGMREAGFGTTTLLNESESGAGLTRRWRAANAAGVERIYTLAPYPDTERPWRAVLSVTDDPAALRAARLVR